VAPGVYVLGESSPAAVYLVDTSAGLVLIDSGLESSAAGVIEQVSRLGFSLNRLQAILLTHVHADHSLGAEQLRAQTGARLYAGGADCAPLRAGGPREAFFSTFDMPDRNAHPTHVDGELGGDEVLEFGDTRITVIAAPGHTPGSMCYLMERAGLRALFTGDVVQHLTARGPSLGTYAAYLPPLYRGNARDYLATLRRLRALPVPDLVLPGHPRADPNPPNAHVSAENWYALLDHGITELERVLARYATDGANFLDGTRKQLLPGLYYLSTYGGSAVYCLATPKGRIVIDAPGDALLVDFLARRFQELGWAGEKPQIVLLTSADVEATAGLAALVQNSGCQVVAPRAGLEKIRRLGVPETALLTEDDLEKGGWLQVRVIPLSGRGQAPLAYQVRWAGKTILFSGRIPVKLAATATARLLRAVNGPDGDRPEYLRSLQRLAEVRPDLWLPAVPVHGQNANLYDDDWSQVLAENRQAIQ
jgi:glyoxylase-like metal-dependent hydrolase (beta-lactamase superfamily II)